VKSLRSSNSLRRPSHDNSNTKWQFTTKSAPTSIFSSPVTSPHGLSSVDLSDPSTNFSRDFNDILRKYAKTARSPDLSPRRSLENHRPNYHHTIQDFNGILRLPAKTTRSPDLSPHHSLGNSSPNYRHSSQDFPQDFNEVSRLPAKTTRSPELSPCRSLGNHSPNHRHTIHDFKDISRLPAKTARSPDLSPHHSSGNHSPNHRDTNQGGSYSHQSKYGTRVEHENNHVDAYPLPLPPGASLQPQQSPAQRQTNVSLHHTTENFHSMRGQWQKGRLIGQGSLGSVYMATNMYIEIFLFIEV
jgi:mitogen-activated protein kinase kinase kinase 3